MAVKLAYKEADSPSSLYIFLHLFFKVTAEVGKLLGDQKVDAILCVAGGWAGGSAKSKCESSSELITALPLVELTRRWYR